MKQNRLFISDSRLLREKEEDFDAVQGTFLAARLIYRTDDERAESLREYLKVWDYLVMLIKYTQAQEQWLDMILAVVSRKEFQLHKIGFSASSTEPRCGDASLQLFNTYRTLLLRTMAWVMQQLEQPVDAVHQSFCASILAVALFRLPALAGHLVNAVCLPAPPAASVGGGAGDRRRAWPPCASGRWIALAACPYWFLAPKIMARRASRVDRSMWTTRTQGPELVVVRGRKRPSLRPAKFWKIWWVMTGCGGPNGPSPRRPRSATRHPPSSGWHERAGTPKVNPC